MKSRVLTLILFAALVSGSANIFGAGGCSADNFNPETLAVVMTHPEGDAADAAINSKVIAVFNAQLDPLTVSASTFYLREGETEVAGTVSAFESVVSFAPAADLTSDTAYTATLTGGIGSLQGGFLEDDYSWTFTTGRGPDTRGPVVLLTTPYDLQSDAEPDTEITATFDEAVDPATLTAQTFTVDGEGGAVSGSVSLDASGMVAAFVPASALARGEEYTVSLKKEISDLSGNQMAGDHDWTFATDAAYYVSNEGSDSDIGSRKSPWRTIQYAVGQVSDGDTVKVEAGTYSENSTIKIDKSLRLIGDGAGRAFINAPANVGAQYPEQTILDVAGSNDNAPENIEVEIAGFTIDAAQTPNLKFAVLLRGGAYAVIRDNVIKGTLPAAGDWNSGNVAVGWTDFGYKAHALIEDNEITDFHSFGIAAYGPGNAATIRGNRITGNPALHICSTSPGNYAGAMGVVVQNAATAVIANNAISNMRKNPACPPASFDSGIELYWAGDMLVTGNTVEDSDYGFGSYNGYGPNGALIMDGNDFSDNQIGVQFGNITVTSCKDNGFEGNAVFGMRNNMASVVDARNNWWGNATGPTHATNPGGTGDAVSDNVNFNPWKAAP